MDPDEAAFHVYSKPSAYTEQKKGTKLIDTKAKTLTELETKLYNAGFFFGYIDEQPYKLSKKKIAFYDRNPNDIVYAQYLLTKDSKYLELIKKQRLLTLCKLEEDRVFFPTVELENGERAVLTYTEESRMPEVLFEKYPGWKKVRMTFDTKCVVNGAFVAT